MRELHVSSEAAFARTAAEQIVSIAERSIVANGWFTICLCGGSTPRPVYDLLARGELSGLIDWTRVEVYWGDERCVPPDHPDSNYRMAKETLLDHVPVAPTRIHRIRGEDEPVAAAAAYERVIQHVLGGGLGSGRPSQGFDLVLLGTGSDGHTASLFPGKQAVREQSRWVVAEFIERVSQWRVTLTPVSLNAAAHVLFLVTGQSKADAVSAVLEGAYQPDILPAQAIKPTHGRLTWILDGGAASRLKDSRMHP